MSETVAFNMLAEPLLTAIVGGGPRKGWTLPDALAELSAGVDLSWSALRPHQEHAWHAFLVQLAAIALDRAGKTDLPRDEGAWRQLLLGLTGGAIEPWCLMVEDVAQPAFFQPPIPEGSLVALTKTKETPDQLDVLITAKNHDLKQTRLVRARPEHWVFALATLQTMEGWGGATNYGIARMNSLYGNRPCVAAAPSLANGARFRRDVGAWLECRSELIETHGYTAAGGAALLWCLPWDGKSALSLQECDPFFIECCRRVRLVVEGGVLHARNQGTEQSRVSAKNAKGKTGDIWTPVDRGEGKALTVGPNGFSYSLLQAVLFSEDYARGAALELRPEDGPEPLVIARTLVRGSGKTAGFRQRLLPLPQKARRLFATAEGKSRLGTLAKRRVETAARATDMVLSPALRALLRAGGSTGGEIFRFLRRFDEEVDAIFFPRLWQALDQPAEEAEALWAQELIELGRQVLEDAIRSSPLPSVRRYKAIAQAEGLFSGLVRKHFPEAMPTTPIERGDPVHGDALRPTPG